MNAIREALKELENHATTDCQSESAAALVKAKLSAALAELDALSAVPENAERDAPATNDDRTLVRCLADYTRHTAQCNPARSSADGACTCCLDNVRNKALAEESRLATAAARVPGLEDARKAYRKRAYTAESERDAALAQAREREEVNVEALLRAVTERNAARQEVATLKADNAALLSLVRRAIYGKSDRSCTECGKKDGCAEGCEMARAAAGHHPGVALLEELSTLTARVAELEQQAAQVDAQRKVARERAEQRRALVKRTAQALGSNPEEIDTSAAGLWEDLDEANARAEAAEASASEEQAINEEAWDVLEEAGIDRTGTLAEGIRRMREAKPTPAPAGLREAVGPFIPYAREWADLPPEHVTCNLGPGVSDLKAKHWAALRAAYDAAKSDDGHMADLRRVLEVTRSGSHVGDTATELGEETVQAVRSLHGKAAKGGEATGPDDVLWLRKSDVRDALDAEFMPPDSEQRRAINDVLTSVKRALALDTPPSGPGGGEKAPCLNSEYQVGACMLPAGHAGQHDYGPRSRLAPTPTPDVPPLDPEEMFAAAMRSNEEWDRKVAAGMPRCQYGNEGGPCRTTPEPNGWCKYHQHVAARWAKREAYPEPAAPEVVCECATARVLANGTLQRWVKSTPEGQQWEDYPLAAITALDVGLALALAEAKREVAMLRGADSISLDDMAPADRANAELAWGCAGSIKTALRRERANRIEAIRKAAESMRERAKALIRGLSNSRGIVHMYVDSLEAHLSALPLEDK